MQQPVRSTDTEFARFTQTLHNAGLRAALGYLLSLTDYRFIGIFRFENGMVNAAVHVDRDNPQVLTIEAIPELASYCCFVRDSGGVFTTAAALADARLEGHPKRATVQAYCGVPVMDPEGGLIGTLCHYDRVPRDPQQIDLMLQLQVASALAYGGHVPPYPH